MNTSRSEKTFDELPEDIKSEFKPAIDEQGFVSKDAVDDKDVAHSEALVEDNIHRVPEIIDECIRQREGAIRVFEEGMLVPFEGHEFTAKNIEEWKVRYKKEIESLKVHQKDIKALIQQYNLEQPIDVKFVDDVTKFLEEEELLAKNGTIIDEQKKATNVTNFMLSLGQRKIEERREQEGQHFTDIQLSNNRRFTIVASQAKGTIQLRFQPFVDPRTHQIPFGPEAVKQVLGGELTADDYEQIFRALMNLEGHIGDVMKNYASKVFDWAATTESGTNEREALSERKAASFQVMETLKYDYMADVPLSAIFYSVTSKFPKLKDLKMPQPFES